MEISTPDSLRVFISSTLLSGRRDVETDEDLLAYDMIDSMGIMRLVDHIEEDFDVRVPPEDITIENFRTIRAIDAYLQRRQSEK